MVLGYSNVVFSGILVFVSLIVTMVFGFMMSKGKPVFKYHRFFSILTFVLAVVHVGLVLF